MNKQLRRLALVLALLYVALFAMLNYTQVVRADEYNSAPDNTRPIVRDFSQPRGLITSADGVVLAESIPSDDRYELQRTYPTKDLFAHITGYFSFKYGTEGVERQYNDELAGQTDELRLAGWQEWFKDDRNTGDVQLTLRADIQQAAKKALGDREGSVVVMDPRTGAILALWSWPSYDPNLLSTHDFKAADAARALLLKDPRKPLLANAYQERYMPGSTFKIVTTTAGLESGVVTPETTYPIEREFTPPLTTDPIQNYNRLQCGGVLIDVFRRSCNTSFARMSLDVGAEQMVRASEAFGFNQDVPIDLPRPAKSFFPSVEYFKGNDPLLAIDGFGQGDTTSTPLQMALTAAAVANRGQIMRPYVMAGIRDASGRLVYHSTPSPWRQVMAQSTVDFLTSAMVEVVNNGTARCCMQLASGQQAAAKTGTAELGTDPPLSHAWITTFAPAEAPRVVVTVMVKATPEVSAGTGGTVAGPVAKKVLDMVLALPEPLTISPASSSTG
ncbi:MAG TPA: penicillin-binding transpeptidase domain-containing protein [Acidimicrobiales bacterium]